MNVERCTWVNQVGIQCGQPAGHKGGHGNGLLTNSLDDWHEYIAPPPSEPIKKVERFGNVHTDKSTVQRCYWMGPGGRCIYELGHTLPHKEDSSVQQDNLGNRS